MASKEPQDIANAVLPRLDPEEAAYLGDDLKNLRDLVARGDSLTTVNGPVLLWWGLVLALTLPLRAFLHGLAPGMLIYELQFAADYAGHAALWLWTRSRPYARSWRSRTVSRTWLAAGLGIAAFAWGCSRIGMNDYRVMIGFVAMTCALVVAVMSAAAGHRWILLPAAGWLVTGWYVFRLHDITAAEDLFAGAAVLFMLIPGIALTLQEIRAQPKRSKS